MAWLLVAFVGFVCATMVLCQVRERRAERRGLRLLIDNLTEDQARQYRANGYFDATGSVTGRRYRINHGVSRNVIELGTDQMQAGRCFAPQGQLVAGDCMLAQKIAIENYEHEVLDKALPF
jgi:hypothetical protein